MIRRRILNLSDQARAELEQYRDHDKRADIRERCAAVLKIAAGQAAHAVAQTGLLKRRDPDTVYGWLNWYVQLGVDGLISHRHGGPHRGLLRRTRPGQSGGADSVTAGTG